jgi:hypothetical protein
MPYWARLKESINKLAIAEEESLVPLIHQFEGAQWNETRIKTYQQKIKAQRAAGQNATDYFSSGVILRRLEGGDPPQLDQLRQNVLFWQRKMIPAGIPDYYFATGQAGATKEISREPARRYARLRNNWCALLSKGIKKVIDLEIKLVKGVDWYEENARNQYRIVWPKWSTEDQGQVNEDASSGEEEETDLQGMDDLDE